MDTVELPVTDEVLAAVSREVDERTSSGVFDGVRDLRVRLRNVKGALLCVVAVGLSSGGLATSTATSSNAIDAVVGALNGLPSRIGRATRPRTSTGDASKHAAVRNQLKRLLERT